MDAKELMKKSGLTTLVGANLVVAYLAGANLDGANLACAYLGGANLARAYLGGANLAGAYLARANLDGANLTGANLDGANLARANLVVAYLGGANLAGANLARAYLGGANLARAYLGGAYLARAYLGGANLAGAYLARANLDGADLRGAKNIPERFEYESRIVPEGSFVGWKKCRDNILVKVFIPAEARRSNATGRKCRAEFVDVLEIVDATTGVEMNAGVSIHMKSVVYRHGQRVTCDEWNEDRWVECGGGIHFFLYRWEAEHYD